MGKTDWHTFWQEQVSKQYTEIAITKDGKRHIADIKIGDKVYEIQHSPISKEEIEERERFYKDMCWIVDCLSENRRKIVEGPDHYIVYIQKQMFVQHMTNVVLDFGSGLFYVKYKILTRTNSRREAIACYCYRQPRHVLINQLFGHYPICGNRDYDSPEYEKKRKEIYGF